MLFAAASLVDRTSPSQENKKESKENKVDSGANSNASSTKSNPGTPSLKMLPICAVEDLDESSKIYGRSGMTANGTLYLSLIHI